jgi:hypothetical protein
MNVDIKGLEEFVHLETLHDDLVKEAIERGYMSEKELVIGRYVNEVCDQLNPEHTDYQTWRQMLAPAYKEASRQFNVTEEKAEELFNKSQNIRAYVLGLRS